MNAKQYLSRIQELDEQIKELQVAKEMYLDIATSTSCAISTVKVQKTSQAEKMADAVVDAENVDADIQRYTLELMGISRNTVKLIQKTRNPLYIKILYKKYIQFKTLYSISKEIDKSYPYVQTLHKRALSTFEEINRDVLKVEDTTN